jgi:hypothetical protein
MAAAAAGVTSTSQPSPTTVRQQARSRPPLSRKLCRRAHHILRELGDQALAPVEPEPQAEEAIQAAA